METSNADPNPSPSTSEAPIAYVDEDLKPFLPEFFDNRRKDIVAIRPAVDCRDLYVPKRLGHNMKGCGSGYGFDEITSIGGRVEEAAKKSDFDEILRCARRLESYLSRVRVVFGPAPDSE